MDEDNPLPFKLPAAVLKQAQRQLSQLRTANDRCLENRHQPRVKWE